MKTLLAAFAMMGFAACLSQEAPTDPKDPSEQSTVEASPADDSVATPPDLREETTCSDANCIAICVCENNYCRLHDPDPTHDCPGDFALCREECISHGSS